MQNLGTVINSILMPLYHFMVNYQLLHYQVWINIRLGQLSFPILNTKMYLASGLALAQYAINNANYFS